MKIEGRWEPKHTVEMVWEVLNDPQVLAKYTPGCQKLQEVAPDTYEVALKLSVAGIGGSYQATMRKVDMRVGERYGLSVEGKGPIGSIKVVGAFNMAPADGKTTVDYSWDIQIGGPMAGVANRVIGGIAKVMLGQFFKDLESEMDARLLTQSTSA